jgi:hypothetical protein
MLVDFVGLRLVPLDSICKHLPKDVVRQLRERGAKSWSGGIHARFPMGLEFVSSIPGTMRFD